jgi:hypothetical protein
LKDEFGKLATKQGVNMKLHNAAKYMYQKMQQQDAAEAGKQPLPPKAETPEAQARYEQKREEAVAHRKYHEGKEGGKAPPLKGTPRKFLTQDPGGPNVDGDFHGHEKHTHGEISHKWDSFPVTGDGGQPILDEKGNQQFFRKQRRVQQIHHHVWHQPDPSKKGVWKYNGTTESGIGLNAPDAGAEDIAGTTGALIKD